MTQEKIREIQIENETIYMRKGFDGWRVIYPMKNKDGTLNWNNIILGGSIWNFLKIFLVFLLLIAAIVIYHYDTKTCSETLKNIDQVCIKLMQGKINPNNNPILTNNISIKP